MVVNPKRRRFATILLTIGIVLLLFPFVVDYLTMRNLQAAGRNLKIGMSVQEVRDVLGGPHDTYTGWLGEAVPGYQMSDAISVYRSRFDWDGYRGISNADERPYWWTRISPRSESYDDILHVWFRDGKLIAVDVPWEGYLVKQEQ